MRHTVVLMAVIVVLICSCNSGVKNFYGNRNFAKVLCEGKTLLKTIANQYWIFKTVANDQVNTCYFSFEQDSLVFLNDSIHYNSTLLNVGCVNQNLSKEKIREYVEGLSGVLSKIGVNSLGLTL